MDESERIETLNEARQFYLAAPVMMPLIERRKRIAYERLLAKHRDGDTNVLNLVSELSVLNDLENEIRRKEETYKTMETQNGTTRRS